MLSHQALKTTNYRADGFVLSVQGGQECPRYVGGGVRET